MYIIKELVSALFGPFLEEGGSSTKPEINPILRMFCGVQEGGYPNVLWHAERRIPEWLLSQPPRTYVRLSCDSAKLFQEIKSWENHAVLSAEMRELFGLKVAARLLLGT